MSRKVKPGDVFSKDKVTRHTFAKRELPESHAQSFLFNTYDDWLDSRLEKNNGAFVVYGLSKTGKTSMVEQSFSRANKDPITIQGKDLKSIASFWGSIADQLKVTSKWETSTGQALAETTSGGFSAGLSNVTASLGSSETSGLTEGRQSLTSFEVLDALKKS